MKRIYPILITLIITGWLHGAQAQCNAAFTYTIDAKDSSVYTFTDSMNSKSYSHWAISDGTTNYSGSPFTHQFSKNDTFEVCHVVMDSSRSCMDSFCMTVIVTGAKASSSCGANFSFKISGDTVRFFDNSTNANTYLWTFGDADQSTDKNPTHIYRTSSSARTYNVCLYTSDSITGCSDSTCKQLTVYPNRSCEAKFSYRTSGDTVFFTNTSTFANTPDYLWTFGDGTISTDSSPTHVYPRIGKYIACLQLRDSIGNCISTKCDTIIMDTNSTAKCEAKFVASVKNFIVSFNNLSVNANSYEWSFGDGSNSTTKNPTHQYSSAGTYQVCLIVYNNNFCVDTFCNNVKVDTPSCRPSFRVAIDTSSTFKLYLINSSSRLASHTYSWDFGDGSTSTARNPTHQYSSFGKYNVCLTVSDNIWKCTQTYCDSIGMDSTGRLLKADGFTMDVIEDNFSSAPILKTNEIKIYPNPTQNELSVDLSTFGEDIELMIVSMNGSVIFRQVNQQPEKINLDVTNLRAGMYFLTATDGVATARVRFVKID